MAVTEKRTRIERNALQSVNRPESPSGDILTLDDYQDAAARTDQHVSRGTDGLAFPLLGLFGEVGTLLSALKKKRREGDAYPGYADAISEELGDVLWYLCAIASRASLRLRNLIDPALLCSDVPHHVSTFLDLQLCKDFEGSPKSPEFEQAVISLAGKTGLLLNEFSHGQVRADASVLEAHLRMIFSLLINAANIANISIANAAERNIAKIDSRWPRERTYSPLFDAVFPAGEQLPKRIEMHILEVRDNGKDRVIQLWNGREVGSPLTDNKIVEDDYRFHDVFHLAYAGVLGWSPCLRALLRVKRKSRSDVDENEDGARAALTEEGVSALIFQHALRLNYFANISSLDYSLLKSVRDFVSGYEVERCALWQWEKAILDGFRVFRQIRQFRRGIVRADLVDRSVTFEPHAK